MMLDVVIDQARNGELKGLSAVDKTNAVIIGYINLAMVALYSKFILVTEEAIVTLAAGKTMYRMDGSDDAVKIIINGTTSYTTTGSTQTVTTAVDEIVYYAVASGSTGTGTVESYYRSKTVQVGVDLDTELFATDTTNWEYISISTDYQATIPVDDILNLVSAYDEVGPIPINDDTTNAGIYTMSYDTIQVPVTETGAFISIIYKKTPKSIATTLDSGLFATTDVKIPRGLLEPMLHYIGYRAHGSLDGNIQAENNTHLMRFENACKEAEALGVVPLDNITRDVSEKGFI